jgi:SAM-dependent methyltransferase
MTRNDAIESACAEVEHDLIELVRCVDLARVSRFNAGYRRYESDRYAHFVTAERRRFRRTICQVTSRRRGGRILDIGCFIPYVSLTLARLGYEVSVIDKYDFYGAAFKSAMQSLCSRYEVLLLDSDIIQDNLDIGTYDEVLCLAVIEHLNGSPRRLLRKIAGLMARDGTLEIEIPNICEITKRIRFLFGRSPLPDYSDYFESDYPFIGHNREMTIHEVKYMLEACGYDIRRIECLDYGDTSLLTWKARVLYYARYLVPIRHRGELISAVARIGTASTEG